MNPRQSLGENEKRLDIQAPIHHPKLESDSLVVDSCVLRMTLRLKTIAQQGNFA
jgi:hypothetical protein